VPAASSPGAPARPSTTAASAPVVATSKPAKDTTTTQPATSPTVATTPATTAATTAPPPRPAIGRVLWTGDSIAYDLAPAIAAALTDAGLAVDNTAYPGVRLVGDGDLSLLSRLPDELAVMQPDVVVFQISVWDARASGDQLNVALAELHAQVRATGAYIVFVPAPPTIDEPTDALLRDVTARAAQLAADDPTGTWLLDPAGVWSPTFDADLDDDGVPERKNDGVHVCPSGAARFALWLTAELAARFDGLAPTPPEQWAAGEWVVDARYDQPVGACAPLG
jgi:lysophospholipase L1-like esterase